MRRALCLVLAAGLVLPATATAKNRDKSWEFSAFASHLDGDPAVPVDNDFGYGIIIGYDLTAKLGTELLLSQTNTSYGALPDLATVASESVPPNPDPNNRVFAGFGALTPRINDSVEIFRAIAQVTATFFSDREVRTAPYITAGLGITQETRSPFTFDADYRFEDPEISPADPNRNVFVPGRREVVEAFDSSAILTIGAGGRTFLTDNWGIRYEVRYYHHDSFDRNQDEFQFLLGATLVVGGSR